MDNRQEIKSLRKALRALTVMNQRGDATVTEIARDIGTPRTTAYRLLTTLASEGYIEKQPHSDYYRLTSMVTELCAGFQRENLLLEVAKPLAAAAAAQIGMPISVTTRRAANMAIRITTGHDASLGLGRSALGAEKPMVQTPTGLCYLALCPEAERESILDIARASDDPLQALAHNGPRLDMVLERVRAQGFSILELSAYREGRAGVPLMVDGRPVGGVVMSYSKSAMRRDRLVAEYVPVLHQLASDIVGSCAARAPITAPVGPTGAEPAIESSSLRTLVDTGSAAARAILPWPASPFIAARARLANRTAGASGWRQHGVAPSSP